MRGVRRLSTGGQIGNGLRKHALIDLFLRIFQNRSKSQKMEVTVTEPKIGVKIEESE